LKIIIELAKQLGLLTKTPHFNSVINMFKESFELGINIDFSECWEKYVAQAES
jgi:hypothetical protein